MLRRTRHGRVLDLRERPSGADRRYDHLCQLVPVGERTMAVCRLCGPLGEPTGRGLAAADALVHHRSHLGDVA